MFRILPAEPGEMKRGRWRSCLSNGSPSAVVTCPDCGAAASIGDHTIGRDGTVKPSLVCMELDCDFHEWVILENWAAS